MAIADPKHYAIAKDDDEDVDLRDQIAVLQGQVTKLLAAQTSGGGGLTADALEAMLARVAQMSAEAHERAANPSNKTHPGISVYSYPEGDRARPKPDLKCRMFWVAFELTTDTLKADEVELLNQAEPGRYTFTRTDGSPDTLTIKGATDLSGNLSKLEFEFLAKERRDTLPGMVTMLRQAFRIKSPAELELDSLKAEVERLRSVHA